MPRQVGDGVVDCGGVGPEAWLGSEGLPSDGDGDGPQGSQDVDEALDGDTGPVLEVRAMARAANAIVRWASIESFFR